MYEEIEIVMYDALIFRIIISNLIEQGYNEIHTKIFSEKLVFNT